MNKLVSLIIPCYNAESFIDKLIESILSQDYPMIECIFINDGSTDDTENVILSYKQDFLNKNYIFQYHYQKNSKPASVLNKGLNLVTGDYISWPDSDDYYYDLKSISLMVLTLENIGLEYGAVRTNADKILEKSFESIGYLAKPSWLKRESIFEDVLFENKIWYAPICYMFRTKYVFSELLDRQVYDNNHVQNWQIYLPVFFNYKCYNLDKVCSVYLVRDSSISNSFKSFKSLLDKEEKHLDIIINTLNRMQSLSKKKLEIYKVKIKYAFLKKELNLAYKFNDKTEFNKRFLYYVKNKLSLKIIIKFLLINLWKRFQK